jgi:type II secretory pathway pseudopilin PulG
MSNKGFTILEVIIAIGIFFIIITAIVVSIVVFYRNNSYVWDHAVAVNNARQGISLLTKEIREARSGDDGNYCIEKAGGKELIFYSDIDDDGQAEKIRYFISTVSSGVETKECVAYSKGGLCSVNFSEFLNGDLISAQVKVSVEGDFGIWNEYADIYADGSSLGSACSNGCTDCAGIWQGVSTYDVTSLASDGSIDFTADSSFRVDPQCNWQNPNHSMKVQFELSWTEEVIGAGNEFKKSVIEPTSFPISYPEDQAETTVISPYVVNSPPVFKYFDASGNEITDTVSNLKDISLIELFLMIDADSNRPPDPFNIESYINLRNIKNQE